VSLAGKAIASRKARRLDVSNGIGGFARVARVTRSGEKQKNRNPVSKRRITKARSLIHQLEKEERGEERGGDLEGAFPEKNIKEEADARRNCTRDGNSNSACRRSLFQLEMEQRRRQKEEPAQCAFGFAWKEGRKEGKLALSLKQQRAFARASARIASSISLSLLPFLSAGNGESSLISSALRQRPVFVRDS